MRRKEARVLLITGVVLLVLLAVPLFAAGRQEKAAPTGEVVTQGVKLRIALVPGLTELPPLEDCLKAAAAELGAEIEVSNYSFDELRQKLVIDYTGGNQVWDYVFVQSATRAEWFTSGLIYPISKYTRENPGLVDKELAAQDDWFQVSIDENTLDGELTSLPLYVTGTTMYYRKDLLEHPEEKAAFRSRYGYELKVPETYKEFYDVAQFFTRKTGERLAGQTLRADFYGCSHSNKPVNFLWFDYINVHIAFGADDIYNPTTMRPTFNSPQSIAAGEYYVSLVPFQPPGHLTMASGAATAMFAEGNVALQVEFFGRGAVMSMNPEASKVADKVGYAPNPSVPGTNRPGATIHTGNGVALYSLSRNLPAAYKVLELAFSPRIMKKVAMEKYLPYGWIIPRPSIITDPEILAKAPHLKSVPVLLDAEKNYFFFLPILPEYPQAMDIAANALSKALAGEIDVRSAYNQAQAELEALFRKAGHIK